MAGNEIILNMMNHQYFRNGELVNCIYEFSKRLRLPENEELQQKEWDQHPFVGRVFNNVLKKLQTFNVSISILKIKILAKTSHHRSHRFRQNKLQ